MLITSAKEGDALSFPLINPTPSRASLSQQHPSFLQRLWELPSPPSKDLGRGGECCRKTLALAVTDWGHCWSNPERGRSQTQSLVPTAPLGLLRFTGQGLGWGTPSAPNQIHTASEQG